MNNEIKVIKVIDVIGSPYFMDKNDGEKLYKIINKERKDNHNNKIFINFEGIEILSITPLNNSIGKFVEKYGIEKTTKWMKIKELNSNDKIDLLEFSLKIAQSKHVKKAIK